MAELKWICISFSLTLLLSLTVGSLNIDQKWAGGNYFGYEGGFCLPGLCIRGSGGNRVHYGRDQYNGGGYRQPMYCKPIHCEGGSCEGLHLHLDKGLYETLITEKAAKNPSTVEFIPENIKHSANTDYEFKQVKETAMAPESN